jgi:carbon storage regulator
MLVLSRKRNQQIVIDGDIIITILEIRGDQVHIGIDAPKDVPVNRKEIQDAIDKGKGANDGDK